MVVAKVELANPTPVTATEAAFFKVLTAIAYAIAATFRVFVAPACVASLTASFVSVKAGASHGGLGNNHKHCASKDHFHNNSYYKIDG